MKCCNLAHVRPPWGRKLPDICLSASSLRSQAVMIVGLLRRPQGRAKHPTDMHSSCRNIYAHVWHRTALGIAAGVGLLRRPLGRAKHPTDMRRTCKGIAAHVRPLRGRDMAVTYSAGSFPSVSHQTVMFVGLLRRPQNRSNDSYICATKPSKRIRSTAAVGASKRSNKHNLG